MTIPLKHRTDGLGEFEPNDVVPIEHGGTGATTAEQARQNLGISGGGGDSWNWVSINEIGTLVNADNNLVYAEEYFIDGVGGIQFCIKDNILWFKALFQMKIGMSGTGWPLFTITDPTYFPKVGTNNETVIRPAGHQLNAGSMLTQFTYYLIKPSGANGFQLHSAQSLISTSIYSILPTAIGFI
ncbi:hypothetical protein [Acinetobacter bereziniae]|uniref:hypothetical protein n=1 Tax=Acinetobacter bereziniae TaxID=106648 RepID=UPI00124F99F0|nr:hypothetical protein [Acinetobacter bereziniae]